MDKVKEDINWSAVAANAFEAKLAEIATKKEKKTMDDVIQRLRASLKENEGEVYKDGYEFGQEWARDTAEAGELKRLERSVDQQDWDDVFDVFETNPGLNAMSAAEWLMNAIFPANDGPDYREFWDCAIGEDALPLLDEVQFVKGFAEGAVEVWRSVKARI